MGLLSLLDACAARGLAGEGGLANLIAAVRAGHDVTARTTVPQHITASACLVHDNRVLMILSPKFGRWMLPGGHVDAGELPHEAALREFREECGTAGEGVTVMGAPWPVHIDIHWIEANPRRGEPRHQHVDFQYVLTCADAATLDLRPDANEALDVAWREIAALADGYPRLYRALAS